MTDGLRLDAPAKLNLSLAITGRRADGLHELAGTFALLELAAGRKAESDRSRGQHRRDHSMSPRD